MDVGHTQLNNNSNKSIKRHLNLFRKSVITNTRDGFETTTGEFVAVIWKRYCLPIVLHLGTFHLAKRLMRQFWKRKKKSKNFEQNSGLWAINLHSYFRLGKTNSSILFYDSYDACIPHIFFFEIEWKKQKKWNCRHNLSHQRQPEPGLILEIYECKYTSGREFHSLQHFQRHWFVR